jgi:hypothetical protein
MNFARSLSYLAAIGIIGLLVSSVPVLGESETTSEVLLQKNKSKGKGKGKGKSNAPKVNVKADIKKLQNIKHNLASKPVQYGGHREKALQHIDHAIKELKTLQKIIDKKKKK